MIIKLIYTMCISLLLYSCHPSKKLYTCPPPVNKRGFIMQKLPLPGNKKTYKSPKFGNHTITTRWFPIDK